ncbi:MAG: hypothetical protein ACPGJV_10265 [Bacteriovoracaceae bacterium]
MKSRWISILVACSNLLAFDAFSESPKTSKFSIDSFSYEDHLYSSSKNAEAGDQVEVDAKLKYQYSKDFSLTFGFETDPVEDTFDSKTSKFEFLLNHRYQKFKFGLDLELKTDDDNGDTSDSKAISFGPDLDSDKTFVQYNTQILPTLGFGITFYPYNFDGDVGSEFNTYDVTRIYSIDGAPTPLSGTNSSDVKIETKTIPGFVLAFDFEEMIKLSAGFGVATYLHPSNEDFNIESNTSVERWERREDFGTQFGIEGKFITNSLKLWTKAKHVSHSEAKETGSLLSSASSLQLASEFNNKILISAEVTRSKAGDNPYNLNSSGSWFKEENPFEPIYLDYYGNRQNWIDQSGMAYSLKLGTRLENVIPYISYKNQSEHFVFRERESAHRLRTFDDALSHGGLTRYGFGTYILQGKYEIKPEIEYFKAKNKVFGNSADVQEDRFLSSYKDSDWLLSIEINYNFDAGEIFKL